VVRGRVGYYCFSLSLTSAREGHTNVWESKNKKYWSLKPLDIIPSYATSFFLHYLERPLLIFLSKVENNCLTYYT